MKTENKMIFDQYCVSTFGLLNTDMQAAMVLTGGLYNNQIGGKIDGLHR